MKLFKNKNLLAVYFLSVMLTLAPFLSLGFADTKSGFAITAGELLNPDKWFEILKENITIPISKDQEVKIPNPEEALKESSPKLQEINKGVKEEVGIDFAKFFGWIAKVLKAFFQVIINLLEALSKAFGA